MARMRYEFRVTGHVSTPLAEAFPELCPAPVPAQTLLFGTVVDEAHLYGLLLRFQDLGLRVEEMRRLPESAGPGQRTEAGSETGDASDVSETGDTRDAPNGPARRARWE